MSTGTGTPLLVLWLLLVALAAQASTSSTRTAHSNNHHEEEKSNMNGDYVLSSTPGAKNAQKLFPTQYKEYPHKETTSFDVYSPVVSHLYSQVFWKGLPPVKLPNHIVEKFHGKVMAVVGFELDQVMEDGNNNEFSVPINAVYNHHFESTMIGGSVARFELASPEDPRIREMRSSMGHGIPPHQPYWLVVGGDEVSATGQPTRQEFGGANGGEVRQSFHGYAPGFAQLIESPTEIQITPMQIDTWNRAEMDLNNATHFVAGPLPRNSVASIDASYSGLLECPVTTRVHKHLPPQGFFPLAKGSCSISNGTIATEKDCYDAVAELVRETDSASLIQNMSGSDDRRPAGCSVRVLAVPINDEQERVIEAFYNEQKESTPDCSSPNTHIFSASATSLVRVTVAIDTSRDLVRITLNGPSDVWFGVGFGAQLMRDKPWAIIVEGDEGTVMERKLEDHAGGTSVTPPSIHVESDTVEGGRRTVAVTRSLKGKHYSFDSRAADIHFINAVGTSAQFAYHQNKEASSMLVVPVANPSEGGAGGICLCRQEPPPFGQAKGGSLEYNPVEGQPGEKGIKGKVKHDNRCEAYPRTDLLQQKNPTCDVRTYTGGQIACHHMWSLLDADQEIPWPDQPIEYRLKFRFWVQEYDSSYHSNVHRTTWGIGSPVEYDVPKCEEGIPGCSQQLDPATGERRWIHTIRGKFSSGKGGKLVAAHFHCHAPTCLKTALYRCPDELGVCDETTGTLLCEETAARKHGEKGERFNEPGFIYQPPCLWGSPEVGLEPPVDVRGHTLFAIKTADATHGHHGEMAWLQMYYV